MPPPSAQFRPTEKTELRRSIFLFALLLRLALTPLELAAQHLEEGPPSVQEFDLIFRLAAANAIAVKDWHTGLAIDAQIGFFVSGHDDDFNL